MTVKLWDEQRVTRLTVGSATATLFARPIQAGTVCEVVTYLAALTADTTLDTAGRWVITTGARRSASGSATFINGTATTVVSAVTDAGLASATVTYAISANALTLHVSSGTSNDVNWAAVSRVLLFTP